MRFWTSDLHFGHQNVIDFCNRPFYRSVLQDHPFGEAEVTIPDVDAMNKALIDNWNSRVSHNDEVWVVGDFAMGRRQSTVPLARHLNGRKFLIPGNHDNCHKMYPHWRRDSSMYEDAGFTILDSQVITEVGGTEVLVCHFPYFGDSRHDDRYSGLRPDDLGGWLIHGHCHGPDRQRGKMIEVGIDPWGGFPVSEETIQELIEAGPSNLGGINWTID